MTAKRETQEAWAGRYKQLLQALTCGEQISPAKLAAAQAIATLQVEMLTMADKFASNGAGASHDDLNLYLKICGAIGELVESAGLAQSKRNSPAAEGPIHSKLEGLLTGIIDARKTEQAQGVFRDTSGAIIEDPERVALEQRIYNLRHGIDAAAPIVDSVPEQLSAPPPAVPIAEPRAAKPPTLTVVKSEPPKPPPPCDPNAPPSSSELYFGWVNSGADGGQIMDWSPGPHWPRLR